MLTIWDLDGSILRTRNRIAASLEDCGYACHNCSVQYGSKILCPQCEHERDMLQLELEETDEELNRRLKWLNSPFDPADPQGISFDEALDMTGGYFAWEAMQDALYWSNNMAYYDNIRHRDYCRGVAHTLAWLEKYRPVKPAVKA